MTSRPPADAGPARSDLLDAVGEICRRAGARVLGPIPEPPIRGRGSARDGLELLAKCADAGGVAGELRGILGSVPAGSRLKVDVDPR